MRKSYILTASLLCAAAAAAQSPVDNVKFTKVSAPVTSTTSTGNPQNEFYHAQYTGAAWGDVNGDGYPDLFYSDRNMHINNSTVQVNLYYNNGNGTFKRGGKGVLKGTAFSSPVWIDFDNDGRLDLFVSGLDDYNYRWRNADTDLSQIGAHLYRNKSTGSTGAITFEEVTGHGLRPLFNGVNGGVGHNAVAVGDCDNDGYPDIVMAGFDEAARYNSDDPIDAVRAVYLYHNNGDGTFTLLETPVDGQRQFHGLTNGSVVLDDLDNDGNLDLLTTGYGYTRTSEIHLYWNNGDGTFTEHTSPFHAVSNAMSTVADLNNDGLADLIFSGHYLNTNTKNFYICKNLGDRHFEMLPLQQFEGSDGTQIAVGDVNNDGYPDILRGGHFATNEHTTVLHINKGNFEFDLYGAHYDDLFGKKGHFTRITHGTHHLVDADRDGSLDAWFSGWVNGDCGKGCDTELWHNDGASKGQIANTPPAAPSALKAIASDGNVTLTWEAPEDDTTPAEALRYNIFIRNSATGETLTRIPADIATGYIKVADIHGAVRGTSITVKLPGEGSYQWGVQAIDASNEGGTFATSEIDIAGVGSILSDDTATKIEGGNGCIRIYPSAKVTAYVYSTTGVMLRSAEIDSPAAIDINSGLYIVKAGDTTAKVTVR